MVVNHFHQPDGSYPIQINAAVIAPRNRIVIDHEYKPPAYLLAYSVKAVPLFPEEKHTRSGRSVTRTIVAGRTVYEYV
jgi:hypothetical protein